MLHESHFKATLNMINPGGDTTVTVETPSPTAAPAPTAAPSVEVKV